MQSSRAKRVGKSPIGVMRDSVCFILNIFRVGTLYSPLKLFLPIRGFFFTIGAGYHACTYLSPRQIHQHDRAFADYFCVGLLNRSGFGTNYLAEL